MRTSDICPTCSTFSNALCTLYNGAYLPTLDINTLDSLETALIKIEAYSTTVSPTALGDLTDVNLTGLADNQVIQYDAGTATWIPVDLVGGYIPYTGATSDADLGEFQLKTGQLEFDQTPTGTFGVGKVRWNDTDGTTERRLKGNNVTLQDGQEVVKRVVNKTGADLLMSEYKVVRLRTTAEGGPQGQRSAVLLAQADSSTNSSAIVGVVTETITDNGEGFITLVGEVREIDTTGALQSETWLAGDQLYLSATTAGNLTNVVPTSPNYRIPIATVDYVHASNGKISVHAQDKLALDVTLSNGNTSAPSVAAVKTYADSKVEDAIVDGVTDKAPSQNAVFDALAALPDPNLQAVLNAGNSASGGSNFFQLNMTAGTGALYSYFDNGTYNSTVEQDEDQFTALVVDSTGDYSYLHVLRGSISLERSEGVNSSEFFVVNPKAQSVQFNLETPTGTANSTTYTIPLSWNGVFADSDGDIAPYLVYTALISQVGAAAPTAIVLQNTLGVTVSFARSLAGVYTATASGVAFTSNKTAIILPSTVNNNDGNPSVANSRWNSTTVIDIWTADIDNAGVVYNDDCLNNTMLEIRVYP